MDDTIEQHNWLQLIDKLPKREVRKRQFYYVNLNETTKHLVNIYNLNHIVTDWLRVNTHTQKKLKKMKPIK